MWHPQRILELYMQNTVRKFEVKRKLWGLRRRYKGGIKINFRETECEGLG
jgi:hypothetical protein